MPGANGLAARLTKLEERLAPPSAVESHEAGERLLKQLGDYAERIHAAEIPLDDNPRQSIAWRCVLAAMRDSFQVAEWGTPEWNTWFWRRVTRYAFAVHCATHHDGPDAVYEKLPAIIQGIREFCELEEPGLRDWPGAGG